MNRHSVALWAGISAFFGALLAIGAFDIIDPAKGYEYLGALFVSAITAGGVYSKQRLDDAKRAIGDTHVDEEPTVE